VQKACATEENTYQEYFGGEDIGTWM